MFCNPIWYSHWIFNLTFFLFLGVGDDFYICKRLYLYIAVIYLTKLCLWLKIHVCIHMLKMWTNKLTKLCWWKSWGLDGQIPQPTCFCKSSQPGSGSYSIRPAVYTILLCVGIGSILYLFGNPYYCVIHTVYSQCVYQYRLSLPCLFIRKPPFLSLTDCFPDHRYFLFAQFEKYHRRGNVKSNGGKGRFMKHVVAG